MDYDLERGEEITPALLKAIERSLISVIVFSENYASSRWCLDELVHIPECKEKYKRCHVIPIFYNTLVSDIRNQRGGYELEERFKDRTESERSKWKDALRIAANLSGVISTSFRDDAELVEKVVQLSSKWTDFESSRSTTYESELVEIESRVQEIESLLCIVPRDDRVRFLVVGDVRERSGTQKELKDLRNKLLRDLLGDTTLDIQSKTIGRSMAVKLGRKRVLVVLDDVDKSCQLEMLAGRDITFGSGSRIIVITRDMKRVREMEVLKKGGNHDVEMYEVRSGLNIDVIRQALILNNLAATAATMGGSAMVTSC